MRNEQFGTEAAGDRAAETKRERAALPQVLEAEIRQILNDSHSYLVRQDRNLDTFYAWWDGQSPSGRKEAERLGREPFPWEGASDTRVRLAEDIVNDECVLLSLAMRRAQVATGPVGAEDQSRAARNAKVIRWVLRHHLRRDLRHEVELARRWRQIHGASVLRITWAEEVALVPELIEGEDVVTRLAQILAAEASATVQTTNEADAAQVMIAAMEEAQDVVFNEGRALELEARLAEFWPGVLARELRRAAAAIRRGESHEIAVPEVVAAKPQLRALRIGDDVFFPVGCDDVQRARIVAVREWLSEAELRSRAETEEWEDGFAEALLKQKGKSALTENWALNTRRVRGTQSDVTRQEEDTRELVELWTVYRRAVTSGDYPGLFCSVFSPLVSDVAGKRDEVIQYLHGLQPFVALRRERLERPIMESRGIPEIVMTWQAEIKTQRDARTDRAGMDVLPPVNAPTGTSRQKLNFGPGAINYLRDPGAVKFMAIGGHPGTSIEVERRTMEEVNWFFARDAENVPVGRRMRYQQELVDAYLSEMVEVMLQVWQLCQQYLDRQKVARIAGGEQGQDGRLERPVAGEPLARDVQEIREDFDTYLYFDAREADPELLKMKMEVVNQTVLPADAGGVVDRAKYTRWQMHAVDAELAEETLQPVESMMQTEVEDEQLQLAKIWAGIEPPFKEGGQNAQLRLQTIANTVQANPQWQQRMAPDQDPIFRQLIEARAKHFQHVLDQEQNKTIGRVGVAPVLGRNAG